MIRYKDVWARIPEYTHFLTVPELNERLERLAQAHPEETDWSKIGKSRNGTPLHALRIGNGSQRALWFACPHPNEPIGSLVIDSVAQWLLNDAEFRERMDTTWYLVPSVDPDGTELNEEWFRGPFTVSNYARHFFRPASFDQVEWTFPFSYKQFEFTATMPETEALMGLIDEVKPDMMYSLHNAGFGGVFYYLTKRAGAGPLYERFHEQVVDSGLPLALGEPEMPWAETLSEAIYELTGAKDAYDFFAQHMPEEQVPAMMHGGGGSADYSSKYGTFTLVCEVPYFYDERIADAELTDESRRDVLSDGVKTQEDWLAFVKPRLEKIRRYAESSPFLATVAELVDKLPQRLATRKKALQENPVFDAPATVAQAFDSRLVHRFYLTLNLGVFRRLLDEAQLSEHVPADVLQSLRVETEAFFSAWCDKLEREFDYEAVPIRTLVALQTAAGVATLQHLAGDGE